MSRKQMIPIHREVEPITGKAVAAVVNEGRFVKISGSKTADSAYPVLQCGLGERAFGVSENNTADPATEKASSWRLDVAINRRPSVVRMAVGAAISQGDPIQSDANGKAIPLGSAVHAALDTGIVGSNNAITWTARAAGVGGNSATVTLVDPGGTTASLTVDVANNGLDITVSLARASSALTSTAQNVIDAIQANGAANALVTVANKSTSNGTGIVAAVSKTNLAGGTDPEGSGVQNGWAANAAASDAAFVEVELI